MRIAKELVKRGEKDMERGSIAYTLIDKEKEISVIYGDNGKKGNFGPEDNLTFSKRNKNTSVNLDGTFGHKKSKEFGDKLEWKLNGSLRETYNLHDLVEKWLFKDNP